MRNGPGAQPVVEELIRRRPCAAQLATVMTMIHDPSPHRTSGCPVHFLWDGRGRGRIFVRSGFLGLVLAGAVGTGGTLLRAPEAGALALTLLALAGAAWGVGQALSFTARAR